MADMAALVRAVENRAGFVARRLALDIDRDLHESAAPHRKTGELASAIRVTMGRPSPTVWTVTADVPVVQAATLDSGARPHMIYPRRGRALRFVWNGDVVYLAAVHHPGNQATHWFSRVMNPLHIEALLLRFVGR